MNDGNPYRRLPPLKSGLTLFETFLLMVSVLVVGGMIGWAFRGWWGV